LLIHFERFKNVTQGAKEYFILFIKSPTNWAGIAIITKSNSHKLSKLSKNTTFSGNFTP